jgi:hypothetical protein
MQCQLCWHEGVSQGDIANLKAVTMTERRGRKNGSLGAARSESCQKSFHKLPDSSSQGLTRGRQTARTLNEGFIHVRNIGLQFRFCLQGESMCLSGAKSNGKDKSRRT